MMVFPTENTMLDSGPCIIPVNKKQFELLAFQVFLISGESLVGRPQVHGEALWKPALRCVIGERRQAWEGVKMWIL